jgi:hypothetical protein
MYLIPWPLDALKSIVIAISWVHSSRLSLVLSHLSFFVQVVYNVIKAGAGLSANDRELVRHTLLLGGSTALVSDARLGAEALSGATASHGSMEESVIAELASGHGPLAAWLVARAVTAQLNFGDVKPLGSHSLSLVVELFWFR